jgi:membrane-anchored glycerophosphoryl diester phosphodiesterase (GDPDase)
MFATLLQLQLRPENDLILDLTNSLLFLGILKFVFIFAALLYVVFSFVVVRQISLMRQTVITSLSTFLRVIGYLHLILSIAVVAIFFIVL